MSFADQTLEKTQEAVGAFCSRICSKHHTERRVASWLEALLAYETGAEDPRSLALIRDLLAMVFMRHPECWGPDYTMLWSLAAYPSLRQRIRADICAVYDLPAHGELR